MVKSIVVLGGRTYICKRSAVTQLTVFQAFDLESIEPTGMGISKTDATFMTCIEHAKIVQCSRTLFSAYDKYRDY